MRGVDRFDDLGGGSMSACRGDSKSRCLRSLGSDKSLRVWITGLTALEPPISPIEQFLLQLQLHNNSYSELHPFGSTGICDTL